MATIDDIYAKLERIERRLDRIEGRLASQQAVRPPERQVAYEQRPKFGVQQAQPVQRQVQPEYAPQKPESKEDRQAREIVEHIIKKDEKVSLKELKYLLGFTDEK